MAIFELTKDSLKAVQETSFAEQKIQERGDLQRLLINNIAVLDADLMVIAEEFRDWQDSRRRIDLLCIDKGANLVVVELKRTEDGGHMELQAIRYAAMVSAMTFKKLVEVYQAFLAEQHRSEDGRAAILEFLDWDEPNESEFAQRVRIILASAEFSAEITTSVIWLNRSGLDIRCIRLKPYVLEGRILLDVQQLIPLPEAADFQIKIREKEEQERKAKAEGSDWTRFDIAFGDHKEKNLYKRTAIFTICRRLCDSGINPEEINQLISWRPTQVWRSVPADVDSEQYIEMCEAEAEDRGSKFNPGRWYCDDDDLVKANGKTYAFSNQWGGEKWHRAMALLKDTYAQYKIEFHESSG